MNKEILEAVTGEVRELLEAGSCCKEAKDAAQAWLDAVGTDKENEQAKKLVAELEEDIMPIDGLIAFAGSDMGAKVCESLIPSTSLPLVGSTAGVLSARIKTS